MAETTENRLQSYWAADIFMEITSMRNGKVSEAVLKRSVLKQLHSKNSHVIQAASVGLDNSVLSVGDSAVVMATESVSLNTANMAERAVTAAVNTVAISGAEPVGVMTAVIFPTVGNEAQLRELMRDLDVACSHYGIQVMGGHTEVSRAVKSPVLTVTAVGLSPEEGHISSAAAMPGMDVIMTGWIAMDGTSVLAMEREEELCGRFSRPFIDKAKTFRMLTGIAGEAAVAAKSGAAAMHDASEGGIFGALWEFAEASGVGLEINLKKIPIRQETVEICEFFNINPYKLLSAGCLLIAAKDGNQVVREIEKAGGHAVIVGVTTDSNDRVLLQEGERRFLETVQTDEIYKVLAQ